MRPALKKHVNLDLYRTPSIMSIDTQQFAQQLIDAWNAHDARRLAAMYADDYVGEDVGLAHPLHGPRDVRRMALLNFLGMHDLHFTLDDVIGEGDRIVLIWTMHGTHTGKVLNIPATGQKIEARGMTRYELRDGRIIRSLRVWDVAGIIRQLGLLPDAPSLGEG
jgi:steroid delta-isomerase-like uncharacterized protein